MTKYYDLIMQYEEAGNGKLDVTSKEDMIKFYNWALERYKLGKDFLHLLKFLGIDFDNDKTAEVGKNKYDSIVLPYETRIITNCDNFSSRIDDSRIINADFEVYKERPTLLTNTKKGIMKYPILDDAINTYMFCNPYYIDSVDNLADLHNGGSNIIVGMYGKKQELDYRAKVRSVANLKNRLNDDFKFVFAENDESYICALASKRKRIK